MNPTLRYAYSRNGDQGRVDEKCLVHVQIPTVDSTDGGKVRYHVRVSNIRSGQVWEVPRRFSEFLTLRNELIDFFAKTDKKCPGCRNYEKVLKLFEFPRKHVFTSVTPVVINYRKKALRNFVALLASHTFTTTPKCPTCSGFPFTGVRDWLMAAGADSAISVAADGSPTNEIRDTLDVKDFTNYHPVSNAMPVDQEGRFVGSTVPKYTPPVASPTKRTDNRRERRSPPRPQVEQLEDSKSQLRYSDGDSSISSINDPPSPPSVDEFVMPVPAPAAATHMKEEDFENDIEGEDDEGFTSFVASSTSSNASARKNEDQPACEPPASDDSPASRTKTVEKKNFKFTRSSIGADSERSSVQPRESSMIDIDGLDDDDDEGLNMDFMNSVHVANGASK